MPQIINTNISSINAQRNLNKSQGALQTSLQRLSSGLRINSAKDDAAGLAISNRFQTAGLLPVAIWRAASKRRATCVVLSLSPMARRRMRMLGTTKTSEIATTKIRQAQTQKRRANCAGI